VVTTLGGLAIAPTSLDPLACDQLQLYAIVPSQATATAGPRSLVVDNGAGRTSSVPFLVTGGLPRISSLSPTEGAPGTAVSISGVNLGLADRYAGVTFNGARAAITSWADGVIVVQVPADALDGPILVQTYSGAASSSSLGVSGNFHVLSRPADGGLTRPDGASPGDGGGRD
jgi:hypothetical protein